MTERTPQAPPVISSLPGDTVRTRWSVMIPAYNCAQYLQKTIESVLVQAPSGEYMQIEVIDDYSTDADVAQLVQEVGRGRVGYYRQPRNVGSLRNFETCINRARGELVHILHGDDFVKPGFYEEMEYLFARYPNAGAAFTDYIYVNEHNEELRVEKKLLDEPGLVPDWLYRLAQGNRLQAPCVVVKRSVYEQLGSFFAVHYGEDWEMWVRIASKYEMPHSPKHLACYRIHKNNISSRSYMSGQDMRDIARVIDICQAYIPAPMKKTIRNNARRNFSLFFCGMSHVLYDEYKKPLAALKQGFSAVRFHTNKETVRSLLVLLLRELRHELLGKYAKYIINHLPFKTRYRNKTVAYVNNSPGNEGGFEQ